MKNYHLIAALSLLPLEYLAGQIRVLEVRFEGVNCAPCLESLPNRAKRIRGVEKASVDAAQGSLRLELAESNRVRVEQIRDMIQQDGTRAVRASEISVVGTLAMENGRPVLAPFELEVTGKMRLPETGTRIRINGTIDNLKSSPLVIRVLSFDALRE